MTGQHRASTAAGQPQEGEYPQQDSSRTGDDRSAQFQHSFGQHSSGQVRSGHVGTGQKQQPGWGTNSICVGMIPCTRVQRRHKLSVCRFLRAVPLVLVYLQASRASKHPVGALKDAPRQLSTHPSTPPQQTHLMGGGSSSASSNLSCTARRLFLTSSNIMWCRWLGTYAKTKVGSPYIDTSGAEPYSRMQMERASLMASCATCVCVDRQDDGNGSK